MKLLVIAQILLLPFLALADCKVKCQKIRNENLNDLSSSVCKKVASQAHNGPFRSCIDGRKKGFDQCVSICLTGTHAADSYEGCKASKGNAARRNMMQWCRQGYDEILATLKAQVSTKKPIVEEDPSVIEANVENLEPLAVEQSEVITEKNESGFDINESSEAAQDDVVESDEALEAASFSEVSDVHAASEDNVSNDGQEDEDDSPSHGNLRSDAPSPSDTTIETDDVFHLNDEM